MESKSNMKRQKGRGQPSRKAGTMALYRNLSALAPRSYNGQLVLPPQWVWGAPADATTSAGSVLSAVYSTDPVVGILGWAGRFQAMWDEYRVVGVEFHAHIYNSGLAAAGIGPYVAVGWFDEISAAAPTANESRERELGFEAIVTAYTPKSKKMRWRARDLNDLNFTATGTSFSPVSAKIYSDAAGGFGTPNASSKSASVRIKYLIEFRGLKST